MATMTISEAEHIIDVVCAALSDERIFSSSGDEPFGYWYKPISILQGYDLPQINAALKLRIANMFLFLIQRADFNERFTEELRIGILPIAPLGLFIPDYLIAKLKQLDELSKTVPRNSPEFRKHERSLRNEIYAIEGPHMEFSYETSESFGAFCRSIGANDPIYWQKIYTHLGLEYTSSAPKGNSPVRI